MNKFLEALILKNIIESMTNNDQKDKITILFLVLLILYSYLFVNVVHCDFETSLKRIFKFF